MYCSLVAVHVSSDVFAHHKEHLNCIYSHWYYTRESFISAGKGPRDRRFADSKTPYLTTILSSAVLFTLSVPLCLGTRNHKP
jgi:hypothetical protein